MKPRAIVVPIFILFLAGCNNQDKENQLNQQIATQQREIFKLRSEMKNMKMSPEDQMAKYRDDRIKLEKQIIDLKKTLANQAIRPELIQLEGVFAKLEKQNHVLDQKIAQLEKHVKELEEEVDRKANRGHTHFKGL